MSREVVLSTWEVSMSPEDIVAVDVDLVVRGDLPDPLRARGMQTHASGPNVVPAPEQSGADDALAELLAEVGRKPPGELMSVTVTEEHDEMHVLGQRKPEKVNEKHHISATYDRPFGDAPNAEPVEMGPENPRKGGISSHPAQAAGSGNVGMSYVCATCDSPIKRSNDDRIERGDDHYCDINCLNKALQTQ